MQPNLVYLVRLPVNSPLSNLVASSKMAFSDSELNNNKKKKNIQHLSENITTISQEKTTEETSGKPKNPKEGEGGGISTEVDPKLREPAKCRKRKREESSEEEESDSSSTDSSGDSSSEDSDSNSSRDDSSSDSNKSTEPSSSSESDSTSSRKKKKRKKSRNRRIKKHKHSREDQHFNPKSAEENASWKLSKSKASYVRKNFNSYISEKTLKDSILEDNPTPKNIGKPKELDGFMKDLYYDSKKSFMCEGDKKLRKVQQKLYDVMGPLGTLWKNLSKGKRRSKTVRGDEIVQLIDQSVILLGQANNAINFLRRMAGLTALGIDRVKASSMLKNNGPEFKPKSKELFGKRFRKTLISREKDLKLSRSLIRDLQQQRKPNRSGPSGRGASSEERRNSHVRTDQQQNNNKHRGEKRKPKSGRISLSPKLVYSKSRTRSLKHFKNKGLKTCRPSSGKSNKKHGNKETHSGQVKVLFGKLGITYNRPVGSGNYKRNKTGLNRKTQSKHDPKGYKNARGSERASQTGNNRAFGKGSNLPCKNRDRPIREHNLSKRKEKWETKAYNQPKKFELLHCLRKVQNGGIETSKGSVKKGGPSSEIRHEGCIFQPSNPPRLSEICEVYLERLPVRVCLSLFRTCTRSKDIYKNFESACSVSTQTEHSASNLPRRHTGHGGESRNHTPSQGYNHLPPSKLGVCNKPGEISNGTCYRNRIFGNVDKFGGNDNLLARGKNREHSGTLPKGLTVKGNNPQGAFKADRKVDFYLCGSTPCPIELQILANEPNKGLKKSTELRGHSQVRPTREAGIRLVDREPKTPEWEENQFGPTRPDNSIRRGQDRGMGSPLPGKEDRGPMEPVGGPTTHKHSRSNSSGTCNKNFHKIEKAQETSSSDRQHSSSELHFEDGKHQKRNSDPVRKKDLGLPSRTPDHDYCGVPPKSPEQGGGRRIQAGSGPQRMETRPKNFQGNMQKISIPTDNRSVCLPTLISDDPICILEARPILPNSGCNADVLGTKETLRIPPIFTNRQGVGKSGPRGGEHGINSPCLANTNMVPEISGNVCPKTRSSSKDKGNSERPKGEKTSIGRDLETRSMANLWSKHLKTGISEGATQLITDARSRGTKAAYESSWKRWSSWCERRKVDPIRCPIEEILEFLTKCFNEGQQYRTINKHRSAISALHEEIEGVAVGKNPLVCKLMKGVSNNRPPKPRLVFVWDVKQVLDFIKGMGKSCDLNNKDLSLKCVALLSICLVNRGSEIGKLNREYMFEAQDCLVFGVEGRVKHSQTGKANPNIKVYKFPEDLDLCPVETLKTYLQRTKPWRKEGDMGIFLSYKKPHDQVSKKTIARWLLTMLERAGIPTSKFTAHSFRSAGSSKARALGVSLKDILKQGSWKSRTVWERHYNKAIVDLSSFQSSILKSSSTQSRIVLD